MLAGGLLAAWGLFIFLGLAFFKPALIGVLPRFDVTSPETGLSFILAGIGMLAGGAGGERGRRWQIACAGTVLAVAVLAQGRLLLELAGWLAASDDAARMTPATAAALTAGCLVLALGPRVRTPTAAYGMQLLLLALLALALLANSGHLLNLTVDFPLFDLGFRHHSLGWPTAVGLVALVAGTFLLSSRMSWFRALYDGRADRQIFVLSATMLLVVAIVAGMAGVGVFARESMVAFKEALRSALTANSQLVISSVEEAVKEVEHISRMTRLEDLARRHGAAPGPAARAAIQEELDRLFRVKAEEAPAALAVVDAAGGIAAAAGERGMAGENRVALSTRHPSFLSWRDGYRLEVRYAVLTGDRRVAEIVAEFRLDRISRQLNYTGPLGSSGEVVICAKGPAMLDCYPSRLMHGAFQAPPSRGGHALPMTRALAGEENVVVGRDYRGTPVIAAFRPLAGLGLGMVQKLDADEFYTAVRKPFWLSAFAAGLLVFGAAAILYRRIQPTVRALDQVSRVHAVLSKANRAVVRMRDLHALLDEVCRIAVDDGAFVMAWAGVVVDGRVIPYAHAGREEGYLEQARIVVRDKALGAGPTGAAIREGRHFVCDDVATDPRMEPWRELALARGYASSAAFPVQVAGEVVGALNFYAPTPRFFSPMLVELLRDLTNDVSFAMNALAESERLRQAEEDLTRLNEQLERRVHERTRQLEAANKELEAFSYSVSHDLRAPLRAIDGFSQVLLKRYNERLDDAGRDYLGRVRRASQRMGELIDDLLELSRVTRGSLRHREVDLSALAWSVVEDLRRGAPERGVDIRVQEGMTASADPGLLRAALDNLLGNAWKFTRHTEGARIEFDSRGVDGELVYCVRDNGAGFDSAYADKLFRVFQRLHSEDEFEGTGIGLATVQRIVSRHGGRIWAEGEPGAGAAFFFTLAPAGQPNCIAKDETGHADVAQDHIAG